MEVVKCDLKNMFKWIEYDDGVIIVNDINT